MYTACKLIPDTALRPPAQVTSRTAIPIPMEDLQRGRQYALAIYKSDTLIVNEALDWWCHNNEYE